MKVIDVVAVALRIMAIIFIYKTLNSAPALIDAWTLWLRDENPLSPQNSKSWMPIAFVSCELLVMLIVLYLPVTAAKLVTPAAMREKTLQVDSLEALKVACFAVLGVYILSQAIPDIFANWVILAGLSSRGLSDTADFVRREGYMAATVVQLAIGIFLVVGSGRLVKLLTAIRG